MTGCSSVFSARRIRLSWSLLPLLWAGPASLQAKPEAAASSTPPAQAAAAESSRHATPRDLGALRREVDEQLLQAEQRLEQATAGPAAADLVDTLRQEISQLKYLALVYAQQQLVAEERQERQHDLDALSNREVAAVLLGADRQPPFSIVYLEQRQDELDDESTKASALRAELEAAQTTIDTAKANQARAESARRKIKEQLEESPSDAGGEQLRREARLAEWSCRVARETTRLREEEIELKKLDLTLRQQRQQQLQGVVARIKQSVQFSAADLAKRCEAFDRLEAELNVALAQSQDRLREIDQLCSQPPVSDSPAVITDQDDAAAACQMARGCLHDKIAQIQQTLADLVTMRHLWELRYEAYGHAPASVPPQDRLREVTRLGGHFRDAKQGLEIRLEEVRGELATIDKQRRSCSSPDDPRYRWLQLRHDAATDLLTAATQRLQAVHLAGRTVERVRLELEEQIHPHSAAACLANTWSAIQAGWNFELLAVDDRPITTGKVVSGILMLLASILSARMLSRTIGKRLLPRLGLAEGASLALQTISFYGLVILFGVFTLEMLNIPITVFTFCGGAAAIAIGFGSQNILNNFMSGLILLSEQPVRIGDFVDIGGLTGTIHSIGARSTRIRTGSNVEHIVPNSKFLDSNVTNWTLSSTEARVSVQVGVAYGSPPELVIGLLRQAVCELPQQLPHHEAIVLFSDFGDSALLFETHFWIQLRTEMDGRRAQSDLRLRIDELFREAGITLAFPQRDVHLDVSQPIALTLNDHRELFATRQPQHRAA